MEHRFVTLYGRTLPVVRFLCRRLQSIINPPLLLRERQRGPRKAARLCGERTSDGVSETSALAGGEGYTVREDAAGDTVFF